MNKDQKGDLVEQLIFQAYKDKDVRSAVYFKDLIKKEYGYKVSSDLYAKIINYQVNKYGVTLQNLNHSLKLAASSIVNSLVMKNFQVIFKTA